MGIALGTDHNIAQIGAYVDAVLGSNPVGAAVGVTLGADHNVDRIRNRNIGVNMVRASIRRYRRHMILPPVSDQSISVNDTDIIIINVD